MADTQGPRLMELMTYLMDIGGQGCVEDIFPYLDKAFIGVLTPNRLMVINTLRSLLQQKIIPPDSFNHKFMEGLLLSMDNSEQVIAKAWLDIILDVTELAPIHVLKSSILPVAVSMGQLSESVDSRVACSELLGKMAARFDSVEIDKEIVPLVHSLCQDVASEVRASICRQLPVITKGLSSDAVLLPLIVELAIDEEPSVRLAAVQAVADLLPHLKQDVIKDMVVPLFKRICEESSLSPNDGMCIIAKNYAHFCLGIEFAISLSDKVYFLRFFKLLAKAGLGIGQSKRKADWKLECRFQCAYIFPSMVSFSGAQLFEEILYPTYVALASDPFHGIRRSIAAGLHEVMKLLGNKCVLLRPQLIAFLNDSNFDVLQVIVPNISDSLEQIARTECLVNDVAAQQLAQALANCERVLHQSHTWRVHAAILAQLECAPRVLPADIIQNTFNSVLLERVQNARPMPCRLAAARTLLVLLRHTVRADQRTQLRDKIIAELCNNRSCHCRLLFVKMCEMALDIFSTHYFKEHFYLPLLSRARDPIPNIRLLVCRLLPRLKMLLRLPQDSAKLALLDDAVHQLAASKPDQDVTAELLAVRSHLDCITVRSDPPSIGLLSRSMTQTERDDDARYEEELKIAQSENRSRKLVTVNMKTLGQGSKPSLIAIPPVESSKRSPFHVTSEPRRTSDTSSILSHLTSALNDCTLSNRSQGLSKSCTSINSAFPALREDEFYVDAGVSLKMVRVGMSLSNIPTVRDMFGISALGSKTNTTTHSTYSSTRLSSPKLGVTPRAQGSVSLTASSSHITKASSLPITKSASKRYSHVLVVENKTVPDLKVILCDKKSSTVNRNTKVSVTVNNKPLGKPVPKNTSVTVLNRRQASMESVSTDRRRVALSSIGVRPQSCIAVGSRSLSQESLRGLEGTRSPRLSQIPRGALSCHSSPGNSRASSPPRMPQAPALVSRLPVRRDPLSMSK